MDEKDIINALFEVSLDEQGQEIFSFRNKAISNQIFLMEHYHEYGIGKPRANNVYEFDYTFSNQEAGKLRVEYLMDITIDSDSQTASGKVTMARDYGLRDSACMSFYNLGLELGYHNGEGDAVFDGFIPYDKEAIQRRHTIKSIIES